MTILLSYEPKHTFLKKQYVYWSTLRIMNLVIALSKMKILRDHLLLSRASVLVFAISLMLPACSRPAFLGGIGTSGKYLEAKEEITRRRGGNIDKAIVNLETVVRDDPTYRDSLTLLGRAYYVRERYGDARMVLQRALAVDKDDEIAWLVLGVTQLRLGENGSGLQATKGGLTLFSKVSTEGYRGYKYWDRSGKVRIALRRAVVAASKEADGNENLIRSVDNLLAVIDDEEWNLRSEKPRDLQHEIQGVGN
jgi:tetratricopeptide (TPR) repeat protein